jgi:hypothetical protein
MTLEARSAGWDNWATDSWSLNSLAGKSNVTVRFRYTGKASTRFGITLDEIKLTAK